jgi:hypothetical protein
LNWQHFRTFVWLRWRLRINQVQRAGTLNAVILGMIAFAGVAAAVGFFFTTLITGLLLPDDTSPLVIMGIFDALVVAFLFSWMIGLMTDLQRSDVLSLDKFLHLPVSLTGAFLINYLSSIVALTTVLFVPAMLGLALGLVFSRGPRMLILFPLVAGFLLMVTALTHQFRSWLATMMMNQRKRRTIIVVATMIFILIFQVPNLINIWQPWTKASESTDDYIQKLRELGKELESGKITVAEFHKKSAQIEAERHARLSSANHQMEERAELLFRMANEVLPPGWLPYGALAAEEGDLAPGCLGVLGLTLIGVVSLWRSYRTTLRYYTGQIASGEKRAAPVTPVKPDHSSSALLEKRLPWISEEASAVALASFRSLLRAPESKMLLLGPLLMVVIFSGLLFRQPLTSIPEGVKSLFAFGATAMILLGLAQVIGNQFGFDRTGFRVYVLCGAPRKDILLGKNLAAAPVVLLLAVVVVVALQVARPMRIDYFLAVFPQMISMYLVFCLLANLMSILAPMPVAAGAIRASNVKGVALLLQLVFVFLFPLALLPMLIPLGVEVLLEQLDLLSGVPICLILSLLECAAVVFLYRLLLGLEGSFLHSREQRILEIVTGKAE